MNNVNGFVIRNKPWTKWFFVIVLFLSLFAELIIGILIISKVMPFDMAPFLIIPVFAFLLSMVGMYVYIKEAFIFKYGTFTYRKVFKKSQSIKIENISCVVIKGKGLFQVEFVDKNGKTAISFLDDGTAFSNNLLIATLTNHNIPIKNIV